MLCMNRFKQITVYAIFLGLGLFANVSFAQDSAKTNAAADSKIRNIDGVAAVVNTGFVTRKEIDDRIATLKKQGVKLPEDGTARKVVLDRLILEKIQLQNAEQDGVKVSDKELDKIIGDIATKNKLTLAELKAKINASGTSFERYRDMLRNDIIVSRYREREVEGKLKISDAEIDNFIAERTRAIAGAGTARSAPAAKGEPEEIDVAQIFIPVDAGAGAGAQAEAKKKADTYCGMRVEMLTFCS
jgi:peptidyl-prolyl cis-trans isomerase SurA